MSMLGWKQEVSQLDINVGIELEVLYGSRSALAEKTADKYGITAVSHVREHGLDTYIVGNTPMGVIKIVSDASVSGFGYQSCEIVTPVFDNSKLPAFLEYVNFLETIGVKINATCGMHVHTSLKDREITPKMLEKLLQHTVTRQDMIWLACRGNKSWCRALNYSTGKNAKKHSGSMESMMKFWYTQESYDRYGEYDSDWNGHYNESRYRGVNLHSFFQGKGIEFRYFESTLDTDKIMAYIELSRGMLMDAVNSQQMRQYVYVDRPYDIQYDGSVAWKVDSYLYAYADLWKGYMDRMQISSKSQKILLEHYKLD